MVKKCERIRGEEMGFVNFEIKEDRRGKEMRSEHERERKEEGSEGVRERSCY